MRILGLALAVSLVVACVEREVFKTEPIDGALMNASDGTDTLWSYDRSTGKASRYGTSCTQQLPASASVAAASHSIWAITRNSLWWLSPRCDEPRRIFDGDDEYSLGPAAALDDGELGYLVVSAEATPNKQARRHQLYLIRTRGTKETSTRAPVVFLDEGSPTAIATSSNDSAPMVVRFSRDGRQLWIAMGKRLCRLDVAELRGTPPQDYVCKGRSFPGPILDISTGNADELVWIASDAGAYAWAAPAEPQQFAIGRVRSIARSGDAPGVGWAITERQQLYRLVTEGPLSPRELPAGSDFNVVRVVAGGVVLVGGGAVVACDNCTSDATSFKGTPLCSGEFNDVVAGPSSAFWLSGASQSARCVPAVKRSYAPMYVAGGALATVVLSYVMLAWVRRRRAPPWFDDRPLDFARKDLRATERLLSDAYPDDGARMHLARAAGIDTAPLPEPASVRMLLERSSSEDRLVRLIAVVLCERADHPAAQQLARDVAGHEVRIAAAILGLKPTYGWLSAAPPAIELVRPRVAPVPFASALEQTINAAAGYTDVPRFLLGLSQAQARVARILVGGHACGTGFLVGDSLLLTNWHVVEHAGDQQIVAQFDYKTDDNGAVIYAGREVACAAAWDVAHSPYADIAREELAPAGPSAADAWDYALLRLSVAVGSEGLGANGQGDPRGKIQLPMADYSFRATEPLLIVGHPLERPMQLSYAAPSNVRLTTTRTRIRYDTNTEVGSSGSPVFNRHWRLVALHHASGPSKNADVFTVQEGAYNQGIPIELIVKHLYDRLPEDVRAELGLVELMPDTLHDD